MTRITFHDPDGQPLAGATVAITAAPGETTDIGYVTDDAGGIDLPVATPGTHEFALGGGDGRRLVATAHLAGDGDTAVTARPAG